MEAVVHDVSNVMCSIVNKLNMFIDLATSNNYYSLMGVAGKHTLCFEYNEPNMHTKLFAIHIGSEVIFAYHEGNPKTFYEVFTEEAFFQLNTTEDLSFTYEDYKMMYELVSTINDPCHYTVIIHK